MDTRSTIRKDRKPRDSIIKRIKMITTKSTNSTTVRRRKATTRNMAANTNFMNRRKASTRKAINMNLATMKGIKVSDSLKIHFWDLKKILFFQSIHSLFEHQLKN